MPFSEILDQPAAVSYLQKSVLGRVPQALLFCGPSGVGKKKAALAFAKALNCLDPQARQSGDCCGVCAHCKAIEQGMYADVAVVDFLYQARLELKKEPSDKSYEEELEKELAKQQRIKVDTIRDITARSQQKSAVGGWKVFIIDEAQTMQAEAAIEHNITSNIISLEHAEELSLAAAALGKKIKGHIKLDAGMGRFGLVLEGRVDAAVEEAMHIASLPGLQIEGVFTHYTDADLPAGDAFNKHQIALFDEATDKLRARGLTLTWDGAVRDYLVKKAYSVTYGARNLRRTIQRDLEDPISERIIDSFETPISEIHVSVNGEGIAVNAK